MIIQALWVWNINLLLVSFWLHSVYLCCCRWADQTSVFESLLFPLMCVIIALTFPMGTRRLITWYHPVPTVSAETTGIIKPSCPATVGEAMLGGNIMHLKSVGMLPHLLPNKMQLPLIQRDLIVFVILYFVWWTPYKYCLLSMFAWLWYSRHVGIKVSTKVPKSYYDALICWNVYLSRRKMASEGKPCELFKRT